MIAGISDQIRSHGQHVGEPAKGPIPETFEEPIDFPALHHESVVSRKIRGTEPFHFRAHLRRVSAVVKHRAISEADLVGRIKLHELDVIGQAPPTQGPQLLEKKGGGDNRGAGIENEAILLKHVGPPAGGVEGLQDRNLIALRPKAYRRSETPETATDYDRLLLLFHGALGDRHFIVTP